MSDMGSNPPAARPPHVTRDLVARLERDYERFAVGGLPGTLENYLLEEYGLDVSAQYAGIPLKNPWGKASGQLSMNLNQVREDLDAGLGFIVLKTVIAQDSSGSQSMQAWATREARMDVERITGATGEVGWIVTWKGRGWWQSFDEYLELVRRAQELAQGTGTLIVPSCKFHLPSPTETAWRVDEYRYTTQCLLEAWQTNAPDSHSMPLEKDFSPTLAGSGRASAMEKILEWLHEVPALVRDSAAAAGWAVRIGLKLFNALFEDEFQLAMLRAVHAADPMHKPDFLTYGNRLFDPHREFDGHRGVAYGGPDLSDRNLRVMSAFQSTARQAGLTPLPWSATGNITSGRMAVEYALRGANSFQCHTFFQLPADEYRMKIGTRTQRALHELYFHPQHGYVVSVLRKAAAQ